MANLRDLVEKDLAISLEGDWSMPVGLIDPDGVRYPQRRGQVLYDTVRLDPETGEKITIECPVVVLRRSSLTRVPLPGEWWIVEIPESPVAGASLKQYALSPNRPPEGGRSIGYIRLYLTELEQS